MLLYGLFSLFVGIKLGVHLFQGVYSMGILVLGISSICVVDSLVIFYLMINICFSMVRFLKHDLVDYQSISLNWFFHWYHAFKYFIVSIWFIVYVSVLPSDGWLFGSLSVAWSCWLAVLELLVGLWVFLVSLLLVCCIVYLVMLATIGLICPYYCLGVLSHGVMSYHIVRVTACLVFEASHHSLRAYFFLVKSFWYPWFVVSLLLDLRCHWIFSVLISFLCCGTWWTLNERGVFPYSCSETLIIISLLVAMTAPNDPMLYFAPPSEHM